MTRLTDAPRPSGTAAVRHIDRLRINQLSSAQHGIVGLRQLKAAGISRSACNNLVTGLRFDELTDGTFRAGGAPDTPQSRAMAAVIAAGESSMISHSSAAALWGLPGFTLEPLHVTVVRSHNPVPSHIATVHRQRSLARIPVSLLDGLPVVRPEVLIIQLCGIVSPERAGRLFDRAWSDRLLSVRSARRILSRVDTQGLRGIRVFRDLLDERGDDYTPPASGLEARVDAILREAGIAGFDRQVDLGDDAHWCGRVDFVDREARVVLEVDSEKFHTALSDRQHDLARADALARAGFVVGSVTDTQVWHRPWEVVDAVQALRAQSTQRPH